MKAVSRRGGSAPERSPCQGCGRQGEKDGFESIGAWKKGLSGAESRGISRGGIRGEEGESGRAERGRTLGRRTGDCEQAPLLPVATSSISFLGSSESVADASTLVAACS